MRTIPASVLDEPGAVLIEEAGSSWLFREPEELWVARTRGDVETILARLDQASAKRLYVAGFLSYDAGAGWPGGMTSRHAPTMPLAWFGVYASVDRYDGLVLDAPEVTAPTDRALNIDRKAYLARIERIRAAISEGEVYQVNFACKMRARTAASASALFARLRAAHPVGHAAFVNAGGHQVLSLSPELFLSLHDGAITTRPMKGTHRRGRWLEEDAAFAQALRTDPKSRAENLMIVDLMRNDLGRVCEPGSVHVPRIFEVERYPSVLQMTSDVVARVQPGTAPSQLLRATFPPGSVTGAPKSTAVRLIDELESEARGVYCGAIGAFFPGGGLTMNVGIRTLVQRADELELGLGSGIVWDSDPEAEWAEVLLKSRFLDWAPRELRLFETMRREAGKIELLDLHLARLQRSAEYFGLPFDPAEARISAVRGPDSRVKMTLSRGGRLTFDEGPLPAPVSLPWRVTLSATPVSSADPLRYHKTTLRAEWDAELAEARLRGFDEVLHVNERGELTEGCITNLLVMVEGKWITPPTTCGLLPGVWRQRLLDRGEVDERVIVVDDVRRATEIRLCNALRGEIAAILT